MSNNPRIFISYSHDATEHEQQVLALSERLRKDGIDAQMDQYVPGTPPRGWARWMLDELDKADFVLLVCTETYYRRFRGHEKPGKGKGADWEGALITQEVYDSRSQTVKFVPILFSTDDEQYIPEPLRSVTRYTLTSEAAYDQLYDFLLGQAGVEPGTLGDLRRKERRRAEPLRKHEAGSQLKTSEPAPGPEPVESTDSIERTQCSSIQTDNEEGEDPRMPGGRYHVWYATNRNPLRDATDALIGYGVERSDEVHYGRCRVSIPEGHVIGSIGTPRWRAWMRRLLGNPDDRLRVIQLVAHAEVEHWLQIAQEARRWTDDERCGVVLIHGYNVTFEQAALRAAQIGFDLKVRGPMSFFSWPSRGSLLGYAADEAAIEASEDEIARYLVDFAERSGIKRLHVIAHSMGNRGLMRAIQRIAAQAAAELPPISFRHFILAAPDVDRDLFLNLAQLYSRFAQRTTLYVSDRDRALASSRMLRAGSPRAGLAPPVTICPSVDTVHVRNVDLTLLGHGYVAEAREVLGDIHQLIMYDAPPDRRMALREATEGKQRYWVIGA